MAEPVLVGLADSGVTGDPAARVVAARAFRTGADGRVAPGEAAPDAFGHGSALARIVLAHAPAAALVNAQVFGPRAATSAVATAAAIDWLVEAGVAVINLSFGLHQDRAPLRAACARAVSAGCALIAAAPARGPGVFPSSYDGVIPVTGDARCAFAEVSCLDTAQADFGACVRADAGARLDMIAGASIAVAHATGLVAAALAASGARGPQAARAALVDAAVYHGPERRTAPNAAGA